MNKPLIGITTHAFVGEITRLSVGKAYVDAVAALGGAPVCIPLGLDSDALCRIYETLDGLLLPGGDDVSPDQYGELPHPRLGSVDPLRDLLEITVARWALRDDLPTLGICRGIQVLAVAAGGSLFQDVDSQITSSLGHDVREFGRQHLCHVVSVTPGSLLHAALGVQSSRVNSLHHQSVRNLPAGFSATAVADDGVIEAMEAHGKRFVVGVQCHPEGIWNSTAPEFRGLFGAFVDAAAQHAATRCSETTAAVSRTESGATTP